MADGHPGDHAEGAHIAGVDGHICPKAVDDCIDHGVITDQFYLLALAAVHPEGGRKKIIDTEVRRDRYGFLRKNVRTGADTVHTEASDGLMLVRIAQYIVIIAVPDQTIGAEDVPFAVVAQLLLLSDVVGKVLEGNLLSGIDGLIDCMIDDEKRQERKRQKEKVRRRMRVEIDPNNYEFIPAKKPIDYYDNDVPQRVAIYVRVSTDDIRQTTSYELQKKYYEDFVNHHPNWTLVRIYADEGISGTSLKHRDAFNEMIADCRAGKIDLIITKSVSRFARNVMITIGMARELAALKNPVGIFFESEAIFSLKDESQMALTFQATMAEEESHTRSRSMETSLRMRLDNGIPLTPKLLGYTHDADGNLIINPEEAKTVKLAFYMYLFGYTSQQIADTLIALERKSYLGNIKWTSGGVVQILRNERHCGDVLTRKTFTQDFRTHRTLKNRGDRPQSHYYNHHEGIVRRDDFIAVQRMLDNAKYGNRSILPELRVIESGVLRGFVSINPRWAGFKEAEYYQASQSVYRDSEEDAAIVPSVQEIQLEAGDFDLRGFEVARSEFFDARYLSSTPSYKGTHQTPVCWTGP